MIRRREFIAGVGSAAVWPAMARAQQADRVRRIGVLMSGDENDPVRNTYAFAFTQALADLGWKDGRNVRIDVRWGGDAIDRMRALAKELVSRPGSGGSPSCSIPIRPPHRFFCPHLNRRPGH